ncbi:hypothetical protein P170DRAFT_474644 [Aspergillus steynii IBT 23096]|uniref:Mitochondrial carrier protein PET8 n=1 Tax=Aspergillus steynii IBT 23096 TaxID=1392250 RepID=A0A2I2GDW1_9EURO|nr:uncharacterized protein P170DRAFT_474644 [Aspergillus steynii IBT 23096]PLB51096.1 hypothetical protein P170DRAFT_474644 [Aspergillus steynii IBT 23096]
MSFLASVRSTIAPRLALRPAYASTTLASPFHTSSVRPGLKESDHNRDELHNIYEQEKEDTVKSSKEGKAKWKQELASNSEASVKADRGDLDGEEPDLKDLQNKTKHLPHEKEASKRQ